MLKIFTTLIALFNKVAELFSQRQMLDAGAAKNEVKNVQAEVADVERGVAARDRIAAADRDVHDAGELPDDGFRRD